MAAKRRRIRRNPKGAFAEMQRASAGLERAAEKFSAGSISGKGVLGKAMKSVLAKNRVKKLLVLDAKFDIENNAAFNERLFHFMRSPASKKPFSLAIVDFDNLKQLNTKRGYAVADKALALFVEKMSGIAKRHRGFAGRFGGDELKVFVPNGGKTLAIELRKARSELQGRGVSFSAGVAVSSKLAGTIQKKVVALNLAANKAVSKSKKAKATVTVAG